MTRRKREPRVRGTLARLWAWVTQTGYRPELHYMRGGRPQV